MLRIFFKAGKNRNLNSKKSTSYIIIYFVGGRLMLLLTTTHFTEAFPKVPCISEESQATCCQCMSQVLDVGVL